MDLTTPTTTATADLDWTTGSNATALLGVGFLYCAKSVKNHAPLERIFYGYALPCLSFFGVLANIINIIVLTDRRLTARTYTYLAFLAFTDLITLVLYFIDLLAKIHFAGQLWHELFTAYIYLPIGSVTTTSSLLLKVAFTIDRFVYVRNPKIQSGKLSQRERLIIRIFSSCLIFVSAGINIPRMFALYVDMSTGCRAHRDWAKSAKGWFGVYSYVRLAILNVGSIILLAVFNTLLLILVHRSSVRSHRDSLVPGSGRSSQHSQQRSLTLTLIAATLLALAGEVPSTLFNRTSAAVLWGSPSALDRQPFRSLFLLAYTLLLTEYSGNFVTYFLLNKKFRALMLIKLCPSWAANAFKNQRYLTEHEPSRVRRASTASAPLLPIQRNSSSTMTNNNNTNTSGSNNNNNASNSNSNSPRQSIMMPTIDEKDEQRSNRSVGDGVVVYTTEEMML